MKYRDIVSYESRRLFSGAIDLDNFIGQPQKAEEIALSYMFHGKTNHVGVANGHSLTDSISFLKIILDALKSDTPEMILGIAGYGVGKSHFALTIAELLASRNISLQEKLLGNIGAIDPLSEEDIRKELNRDSRGYLVIPINGMRGSSLKDLFFSVVKRVLIKDGVDASCLDEFDPRFASLKEVVLNHKNTELITSILNEEGLSRHSFEMAMDNLDNDVYSAVSKRIKENGIKYFEPAAIGDLKEMVSTVASSLCGENKPYRSMLIIFDEFGKYMAFSASNEAVAGEGCLQLLFEGIQTNSDKDGHVVLLGLSQLDLKEYQMSSGDISFTNTMNRYVTRFDSAKRYYLSACFETLVANLIHIKDDSYLKSEDVHEVDRTYSLLSSTFKQVEKSNVWADKTTFTNVVFNGCWPLSPYLMWTLSYITSVNNLLQQRSGFNLLAVLFEDKISDSEITDDAKRIVATELFDAGLLSEFLDSERAFSTSNPIASEYYFLLQKYANLNEDEKTVLKAIVLTHKLRASCSNRNAANNLLCELSGLSVSKVNRSLSNLSDTYNAVDFNMAMGLYEIHSDTVSVNEFERKIEKFAKDYTVSHTRVELYNEVSSYFNSIPELTTIRDYFFKPINCDFAEEHNISTSEWKYSSNVVIGYEYLSGVERIVDSPNLYKTYGHDEPKGRVIYCIIPKDVPLSNVKSELEGALKTKTEELGRIPPVMILLISDKGDEIFNAVVKYRTLNHLTKNDQDKYFTLISRQKESLCKNIRDSIETQFYDKNYVYPDGISKKSPLKIAGNDIFEEIYTQVIPFYIDGTNWMSSVSSFIKIFSKGNPSWSDVINTNDRAIINRCEYLFVKLWNDVDVKKGVFYKTPKEETINSIFEKWDGSIYEGEGFSIYNEYCSLLNPPYGMNSVAATLLVIVYLGMRTFEFDYFLSGEQISLLSLVQQKGAFKSSRSQVLSENVWSNLTIRKSIKDDAKWISLLNRWSNEKDLLTLIELQKEAAQLQALNVSIPTFMLTQFSDCNMHSENAKNLHLKWIESRETLRNDIETDINKGRIGKPLKTYCDYLAAYKYSLGKCANQRPSISISESIVSEEENYRRTIENYFETSIEDWVLHHPFSYLDNKDKYTETLKKYQEFKSNLDAADLIDEAQDIQIIIDDVIEKRKVFLSYSSILSKMKDKKKNIDKIISNGLFTTSQVEACVGQLKELLQDISAFPSDKLPLITPYSFDELKKDINSTITSVSEIGKRKDQEFSDLMNCEISTIEDVKKIYKTANSLIEFYNGADDNLEDAKLMSQEALLLREAYIKINDNSLSVTKIKAVAESEKKRIGNVLDGNSIFDDDVVIDEFFSKRKKEIEKASSSWVQEQEKALERCKNTQDVNRVVYSLDSLPACFEGLINEQIYRIKDKANKLISSMKLDYIKGLFEELTTEERTMFIDWCNKK